MVPGIIGSGDIKEIYGERIRKKQKKTKGNGRWRRFEKVCEKTRGTRGSTEGTKRGMRARGWKGCSEELVAGQFNPGR